MIAAFRSELVKLLRLATVAGYATAAAGFTVMLTVVTIINADNPSGHGPANRSIDLTQLAEPAGYLAGFESASGFLGIVALALFASSVAAEFSTGTIRALLVIDSRRRQLLAGKTVGLAALLVIVITVAAVIGAIVAFAIGGAQGVNTNAWTTASALTDGAAIIANAALATVVWGLFGGLLAMLTRSAAISIAAGVAYFLIGEQLILHSLWPSTADWLPAGVLDTLAQGGTDTRGYTAALGLTALYALAVYTATTTTFERRDVTD